MQNIIFNPHFHFLEVSFLIPCTCLPELGSPTVAVFAFAVDADKNEIVTLRAYQQKKKKGNM